MYPRRQLLLLSSSAPYGYGYLEYARQDITDLLSRNNVTRILFIPYAAKDHDAYARKVRSVLETDWKLARVDSAHETGDPLGAVRSAQAIFVGGGNTFLLLKGLYKCDLVAEIRRRVLEEGVPYVGSSAGTNVATRSIGTTNDMPIAYPPTFDALRLVPFNINPHYLDVVQGDRHRGETREERIREFLDVNDDEEERCVLGMREGATLEVRSDAAALRGVATARLFRSGKEPVELEIGSDVSFLLKCDARS